MVAILLLLLWEPAITVAELKSQQNIIAVLVDDSHSMAIADAGADGKTTREAAAVKTLEDGVLSGLAKKFQTRVYRLDGGLARVRRRRQATARWTDRRQRTDCGRDPHQCRAAPADVGD